jgi:hypothetical protein
MAEHAWCHDIARDAAVRAAEDAAVADRPTLPDHRELPSAVEHLRSLCHGHFQEFQELVEIVGRINARLERLEAMLPKSVSASSTVEQENKGQSMREKGTKRDEQAADYRAESIAAVRECRSENTKGEEMSQGLRTERVVLEVTRKSAGKPLRPLEQCDWHGMLYGIVIGLYPGESVRVVEEAHFDDLAQMAMELDAAIRERDTLKARLKDSQNCSGKFWSQILVVASERDNLQARVAELESQLESVADRAATAETALEAASVGNLPETPVSSTQAASGGGEGEPLAYFVKWTQLDWYVQDQTFRTLQRAQDYIKNEKSEDENPQIVPLYAAPPQPRGWLTCEERDAVVVLTGGGRSQWPPRTTLEAKRNAAIDACRQLLARSSPPEVVLPPFKGDVTGGPWAVAGYNSAIEVCREALAAAGVAVKQQKETSND